MEVKGKQTLPRARTKELIVRELPEEVLVYDLERRKAHCLNRASAIVWKHCDGKTTAAEAARLLQKELGVSVGTDVVWLALRQLRRFHLLEEDNGTIRGMQVSRRDLVRKYLPAALALPLILSVPAPTAAQASSTCIPQGAPCQFGGTPCCSPAVCAETSDGNICVVFPP